MQEVSFKDKAGTIGEKMKRNRVFGAITGPPKLTLWLVFNYWANTIFLLFMSTWVGVSISYNQKHFTKATGIGPGTRKYSPIQCFPEREAPQGETSYSINDREAKNRIKSKMPGWR